jgi:hypothetical protein
MSSGAINAETTVTEIGGGQNPMSNLMMMTSSGMCIGPLNQQDSSEEISRTEVHLSIDSDKPTFYSKTKQIAALTALGVGCNSSSSDSDVENTALNAPGFILSNRKNQTQPSLSYKTQEERSINKARSIIQKLH